MARPRSQDKRNAILDAATEIVAELGLGAPTAKIARRAGVAEGSLFTYFKNKSDLLNQLYLHLKADLRGAMLDGYPAKKSLEERSRCVWNGYIAWGSAFPLKRKAMNQLAVSDQITPRNKELGSELFAEIHSLMEEVRWRSAMNGQPPAFAAGIMTAIADTTMDFIARDPAAAKRYIRAGFDAFWRAIKG